MINLHKYYNKNYFSEIDFSTLLKKEELELKEDELVLKKKKLVSPQEKEGLKREIDKLKGKIDELKGEIESIEKKNKTIIANRNDELTKGGYTEESLLEINPKNQGDGTLSIPLEVQYPGLVTGIGINHEAKIEGEFKLGVHFDWTYGMPVIYGSSVKGVLSAWFKDFYEPKENQPSKEQAFDAIFDGKIGENNYLSIYDRDIFFDAVITSPDSEGRILCSDSITPHGDNPLENPIPITFMKIAPGCKLEFRFKLVDTTVDGKTFTKEGKKALFEEILTTVGLGAKTNVGYGQLCTPKTGGNDDSNVGERSTFITIDNENIFEQDAEENVESTGESTEHSTAQPSKQEDDIRELSARWRGIGSEYEVKIGNKWVRLDTEWADPKEFDKLKKKLKRPGTEVSVKVVMRGKTPQFMQVVDSN